LYSGARALRQLHAQRGSVGIPASRAAPRPCRPVHVHGTRPVREARSQPSPSARHVTARRDGR
jgi:hypothetical protein